MVRNVAARGREVWRDARHALRRDRHVAESCGIGVPFTMKHTGRSHDAVAKGSGQPIDYPKPDGVLTFDRLSSVFVSNTNHEEDQPVHLTLRDPDDPDRQSICRYTPSPSSVIVRQAFTRFVG